MVGVHLKAGKQGREYETPQQLAPVGQHNTGNHRRQIGQGHHLPDVTCGYDYEEVTAESPYDGAQHGQRLPEIEGPQQYVEAKQVGKHIPYVVGKPQVVGRLDGREDARTVVRRGDLVGGHAAENGVGPPWGLARAGTIIGNLLAGTAPGRGVMLVKDAPFRVCREEISERKNRKQEHCQHIGQASFQCLHLYNCFYYWFNSRVQRYVF